MSGSSTVGFRACKLDSCSLMSQEWEAQGCWGQRRFRACKLDILSMSNQDFRDLIGPTQPLSRPCGRDPYSCRQISPSPPTTAHMKIALSTTALEQRTCIDVGHGLHALLGVQVAASRGKERAFDQLCTADATSAYCERSLICQCSGQASRRAHSQRWFSCAK